MKSLYIYILLFLFSCDLYAQEGFFDKRGSEPNKFNYEYLDFKSDQLNKTRVDVFIQVPYTEIQFVKSDNKFEANYTITVSIFNKDKDKLVTEKIWNEKVVTTDFNQTTSPQNFNLSLRSFDLSPGEYMFRSAYEDKDSRKTYAKEDVVNVRDISSNFALSDIMLVEKRTNEGGDNKILPNIKKVISTRKGGLPLFYEVYSDTSSTFKIEYDISEKGNTVISYKTTKQMSKGRNQIFYTLPDSSLEMGNFNISIVLKDIEDNELASTKQSFISRWVGFPSTAKDLDEAVDQLVYIASPEEMSYIRKGETRDEKILRFKEFWKKKDAVPSTEENEVFNEYYRRIAFANANFSHYIKGWKTDRGMVYIILGNPNNVDRHPFEYNSKPYEVWDYYQLNRSFIFVDETGFGDYRLVTPLTGDLYRYRY